MVKIIQKHKPLYSSCAYLSEVLQSRWAAWYPRVGHSIHVHVSARLGEATSSETEACGWETAPSGGQRVINTWSNGGRCASVWASGTVWRSRYRVFFPVFYELWRPGVCRGQDCCRTQKVCDAGLSRLHLTCPSAVGAWSAPGTRAGPLRFCACVNQFAFGNTLIFCLANLSLTIALMKKM